MTCRTLTRCSRRTTATATPPAADVEPFVAHIAPTGTVAAALEAGTVVTGLCGYQRVPFRPLPADRVMCETCLAEARRIERGDHL